MQQSGNVIYENESWGRMLNRKMINQVHKPYQYYRQPKNSKQDKQILSFGVCLSDLDLIISINFSKENLYNLIKTQI